MARIRDREKQRQYERDWYARNRDKAIAKVKKRKRAINEWFRAYKGTLACIRCGESDPVTLDFHHRNPTEKEFSFHELWFRGWSVNRIMSEIAKCDVLCANCHRKVHRDLRELEGEEVP